MYESKEFSDIFDDDDFFKSASWASMELLLWLGVALVGAVLLAAICRCCCRSSSSGTVISPPPAAGAYPQQQYTPAAAPYPAQTVTVYPVAAAPYPAVAPYPSVAPYPAQAPYPAPAPYPPGPAPYPAAGAPYPHAPTAPDVNAFYGVAPPGWSAQACPPSYEQVMGGQHAHKQPPYNPHAPH